MHNISIHRVLVALLLCGTMTYTNVTFANQINAGSNHVRAIRLENHRIHQAITRLGNHDSGEALLTYHRAGHVLSFQVTDYDVRDEFRGHNLARQIHYFQHHTDLSHLNVQVQLTSKALRNHHIQLREQAHQRVENHIEAIQAMKRAEQQAKARRAKIAKQKAQKAKQKAQAKKKAQQKQQAKKKAQQKKQMQMKQRKAKQNAQKKQQAKKNHQKTEQQ